VSGLVQGQIGGTSRPRIYQPTQPTIIIDKHNSAVRQEAYPAQVFGITYFGAGAG